MLERGKLDRDGGVRGHRPTGTKGAFTAKGICSGISERTTQNWQMMPDDAGYTPEHAQSYKCRKETIERVFADAKENTPCVIHSTEAWPR